MAGPVGSAVVRFATILRDVGSAFRGAMPTMRSAKGTYGTQRMESRQLDEQRRANYPRD